MDKKVNDGYPKDDNNIIMGIYSILNKYGTQWFESYSCIN